VYKTFLLMLGLLVGSAYACSLAPPVRITSALGSLEATLQPGEIKSFKVKASKGAVTWSLKGAGLWEAGDGETGEFILEYRAPRAGGGVHLLTAASVVDPAQQVVYTIHVKSNPAPPAPALVNLLPLLHHVPADRKQGVCSNCYAWAATAALEVAMNVKYGIKDRLSIQYFNTIYKPLAPGDAASPCCANNFSAVLDTYLGSRMMIPWANPHAGFKDHDLPCAGAYPGRPAIGLLPHYRIRALGAQELGTRLWSDEDIIAEVMHHLSQRRAIIFKTGGHYVTLVGYDARDPDPAKHLWRVLDSAGASSAMPEGVYGLPMRPLDYNKLMEANIPHFTFHYVDELELDLQAEGLPPCSVAPAKAGLRVGEALHLTATAGGRPPVTYQWLKDGRDLPEQKGSRLVLPAVAMADGGSYAVRVTNGTGSQTSVPVPVTVTNPEAPGLTVTPATATLGPGAARSFQATVKGLAEPGVLWTLTGPGELDDPRANPVTFRAPAQSGTAVLEARAQGQPSLAASIPITVKSADLDGDGRVDVRDLAILAKAYHARRGDVHYVEAADLNGDGQVDVEDAQVFLAYWDAQP
jgi:hypothetical protein